MNPIHSLPRPTHSGWAFLWVTMLLGMTSAAVAVEPWADQRLTVTDGLLVWLDAAAIPQARQAAAVEPAVGGEPIAVWHNAADPGADFVQPMVHARPRYRPTGDFHAVHFEGRGQHLRLSSPLPSHTEATVFVVAAPYSHPAPFSAFLSSSAAGRNDFQTGLNIDSAAGGPRFDVLNVEGQGSQGARNLMRDAYAFGTVVRICVASAPGDTGITVWTDGNMQRSRARQDGGAIAMDEMIVGGRFYSLGRPPEVRGFFHGDIAEVLIYDRLLSDQQRQTVERYLADKYAHVAGLPVPRTADDHEPLVRVANPPPVQVLVPGFTVRQLPLDLTNINNVQYRPDGVLFALAYDGRVWQLRDTDDDGVEDQATIFWDNARGLRSTIGMDLTPPGYVHGDGVVIVGKTECLLIVDSDGDDRADREIVVADGWKETPHGVDALGVAIDPRDGSIYYGRGTNNFTDPLLHDKAGNPRYDLATESGVIIRVAPDFRSRQIFATGIRFPVAIRFHRSGDLFCTDQEGATWVPNGNPMDELLHVRQGRHYGFPPRHPTHLPEVIDEPSTFDYGPQHQSTCGFCFNEPVREGGPTFGPAAWQGDAFVTGYSRGKLYRTELVKTDSGYVARNRIFACLNMLAADCCVATDGSLVVACHGGGPDWGSGPTGKGKLYKIVYDGRHLPQPVVAWPSTERELRIEFDRPVDPALLRDALGQTEITAGAFVRAGDRYESLWPGYAVVQTQQRALRRRVRVHAAQLTADRRTLILATDPLRAAVHYSVTLPGMGRPAHEQTAAGALPQDPQVDLDFDLSGVQATWSDGDQVLWQGWLPSLDLALSRQWTHGSAHHDRLWQAMEERGRLTLATQLSLVDMLRPAVQPGSTIDYALPPEQVRIHYPTAQEAGVRSSAAEPREDAPAASNDQAASHEGMLIYHPQADRAVDVAFQLPMPGGVSAASFTVAYSTREDDSRRPLQLHRMLLPWAETASGAAQQPSHDLAEELEGGNWARGRKVFYGEQAGCAKCHRIHRHGGDIGPDLSNLIHRDYASVLRDITHPNFAINPDYVATSLLLRDGRVLRGVLRSEGDAWRIGDQEGRTTVVEKAEVEQLQTSPVSTMPEDLLKTLTEAQIRDLLTFLLAAPPSMPRDYERGPRPKPRSVADVNRVLAGAPVPPEEIRPIRLVLVAGPKDHGPGEHDYPAWQKAWQQLLSADPLCDVATAWQWPSAEQFATADVMVFYQHGDWNPQRAADVDAFLARGGGLVYIHWAVDGRQQGADFARRIGLAGRGAVGFRHGDLTLSINQQAQHPVTRNFSRLAMTDETYWKMVGELKPERVLATAIEDDQPQPQVWSLEHGRGRVFVSIPGHYSWTFDDPLFRVLLLRGIAWAAREPVDRFNELVWPGADVAN